jgi:hypothetical protein
MSDQPTRYTLPEAARLTGLSTEALRLRIRRGKLASVKGNDGLRVVLTSADIESIVAGQERQQIPTDQADRPNATKALEDAVATLVEQFGQDRTELKAEAAKLRERIERAEAQTMTERGLRTDAERRAAVAEAKLEAAEAALAEARRPFWRRWMG